MQPALLVSICGRLKTCAGVWGRVVGAYEPPQWLSALRCVAALEKPHATVVDTAKHLQGPGGR